MDQRTIRLICCAKREVLYNIAREEGLLLGAQLPQRYVPADLFFADQDWKRPNRQRYMEALATHRPYMATVIDIETPEMLDEAISWAEEAARYVREVVLIPKVHGIIERIPEQIDQAPVILGYSVPTKFGASEVMLWEFGRRPVHLLGGSPHQQLELARYLNVVSLDGNAIIKGATVYLSAWSPDGWYKPYKKGTNPPNAYLDVFRRSARAVVEVWRARGYHLVTFDDHDISRSTA